MVDTAIAHHDDLVEQKEARAIAREEAREAAKEKALEEAKEGAQTSRSKEGGKTDRSHSKASAKKVEPDPLLESSKEELPEFEEEEYRKEQEIKFDLENPEIIIPDEVFDDIDNDFELDDALLTTSAR